MAVFISLLQHTGLDMQILTCLLVTDWPTETARSIG